MNCAWQAYLNLLPNWMRYHVDKLGKVSLQELRLRLGRQPELILKDKQIYLDGQVTMADLNAVVNTASAFSPWTADSIRRGYITAPGGHRIGVCGEVAVINGEIRSMPKLTSVSVRVAREITGISTGIENLEGSTLIVGRPGTGKTTLLRDIVRRMSDVVGRCVSVVDERSEIFPLENGNFSFYPGKRSDVLHGCSKKAGIEMVLRAMTPQVIALDEITAESDCNALLYAGWCGVTLLATAHAADRKELFTRQVYKPLLDKGLFQNLIVLKQDQSWQVERIYYES